MVENPVATFLTLGLNGSVLQYLARAFVSKTQYKERSLHESSWRPLIWTIFLRIFLRVSSGFVILKCENCKVSFWILGSCVKALLNAQKAWSSALFSTLEVKYAFNFSRLLHEGIAFSMNSRLLGWILDLKRRLLSLGR